MVVSQAVLGIEIAADKYAKEALTLNQQRQAQNIGIPLEVIQAEEALTRARLDLFGAITAYNQAQLRLFTVTGRKHAPGR